MNLDNEHGFAKSVSYDREKHKKLNTVINFDFKAIIRATHMNRVAIKPLEKLEIVEVLLLANLNDLVSRNTKTNLGVSDRENDLDYLLDWVHPYFPYEMQRPSPPSTRVKVAIKSCLRDEASQLDFVRLYANSIRKSFLQEATGRLLGEDITWKGMITSIEEIKSYYKLRAESLHLDAHALKLLDRHINSFFQYVLLSEGRGRFFDMLEDFLRTGIMGLVTRNPEFLHCVRVLLSIGLRDQINSAMTELTIKEIKNYVLKTTSGIWDEPLLEKINHWIETELYPSFNTVMKLSEDSSDSNHFCDLIKITHDELVSLRIKEIFGIVTSYPMATVALHELHQCILFKFNSHDAGSNISNLSTVIQSEPSTAVNKSFILGSTRFSSTLVTDSATSQAYQRAKLVDVFIYLCSQRLLHSGVDTVDIIKSYSATIKSFLIIDPKGVLLDKVARPIRKYLRTREDIILKLVHAFLDFRESNKLLELAKDLRKGIPKDTSDETMLLDWVPDPIDALPDFKKGKVTDIIESLISIFDLKTIFIDEFTKLFGERLIRINDYDVDEISHQLDLLKYRFGENEFTALDIMIKDIRESKLTNDQITATKKLTFNASVLSHLYWPNLPEEISNGNCLRIPSEMQAKFNEFKGEYSQIRKGRYVKLLPELGSVRLELTSNHKRKEYEVTPIQASIIALFNDRAGELSLDEISDKLNIPKYIAATEAEFWTRNNILLLKSSESYITNENFL